VTRRGRPCVRLTSEAARVP